MASMKYTFQHDEDVMIDYRGAGASEDSIMIQTSSTAFEKQNKTHKGRGIR